MAQPTHEIGIRGALGAHPDDFFKLVIGQGLRLALFGVAIGLFTAFATTRLMASLLFLVSPTDPFVFAGSAVLVTLVALTACIIPARHAMRLDPIVALRYE